MDKEAKTQKEQDRFNRLLDEALKRLLDCQQTRKYTSCSQCEEFLSCELRREYVNAVYNSMSKGDSGGFEF